MRRHRTAEHISDKTTFDGVRVDFQIETDARGKYGVFYGPDMRSITMIRLPVQAAIDLSHEICLLYFDEISGSIRRLAKAWRGGVTGASKYK